MFFSRYRLKLLSTTTWRYWLCVCLSLSRITREVVDGFRRNFLGTAHWTAVKRLIKQYNNTLPFKSQQWEHAHLSKRPFGVRDGAQQVFNRSAVITSIAADGAAGAADAQCWVWPVWSAAAATTLAAGDCSFAVFRLSFWALPSNTVLHFCLLGISISTVYNISTPPRLTSISSIFRLFYNPQNRKRSLLVLRILIQGDYVHHLLITTR